MARAVGIALKVGTVSKSQSHPDCALRVQRLYTPHLGLLLPMSVWPLQEGQAPQTAACTIAPLLGTV